MKRKIGWAVAIATSFYASSAHGFDYSRYQAADLDEIIEQPRPKSGADILAEARLKIIGTLMAYGEPCNTGFLKKAMSMGGIPQPSVDAVAITQCIKLRSARGKEVRLFIQDKVAEFLPKEIRIGDAVTLFVLRVFNHADGPGLLVNEFSADSDGAIRKQLAQKSAPAVSDREKQAAGTNATVTGLRGEWNRAGASFACRVTTQGKLPLEAIKPDVLTKACLHMGPLGIGEAAGSVKSALGEPHRTLQQAKDATAWIYFLDRPEQPPYLVATVSKDKIVALQVSGPTTSKDFTFNHIKLGDDTMVLVDYFGAAYKVTPSGEKDTDLWSYSPWPFSFEVRDNRVTSVRITDPEYR
jgi:hypothetical protein